MGKPASLPEWDTTQVNSIEPDAIHKAQGWLAPGGVPEKPPFQTFNFWQNLVYKWTNYFTELNISFNFDSVAAMIADTNLEIGNIAETKAYYSTKEGGAAKYEIVAAATGIDDGGSFIDLSGSSFQAKLIHNDKIDVKWFGAKGDGVNDDSDAIIASKEYVQSLILSGNSGIWNPGGATINPSSGTAHIWFFSSGVYSITKALSGSAQELNYMTIEGERAAIVPINQTIDVFGGIGYNNTFKGLIFRGGNRHLIGNNNNTNSTTFIIDECEFINPEEAAIDLGIFGVTATNMHSAIVNLANSKFRIAESSTGNGYCIFGGADNVNVNNCWVQTSNLVAFSHGEGILSLTNITGVPENNVSGENGSCWVEMTGQSDASILKISNFRAGGEGGGRTLVRCNQSLDTSAPRIPSVIDLKDSSVFASADKYVIEFHGMPTIVNISNINGLIDNAGLFFASDIPAQDIIDFSSYGTVKISSHNDGNIRIKDNGSNKAARLTFISKIERGLSYGFVDGMELNEKALSLDEIIITDVPEFAWVTTSSNMSRASVANNKGLTELVFTSTAADAFRSTELDTFIDPATISEGIYCLNFHLVIEDSATIEINIGSTLKEYNLVAGDYILRVPFYYHNDTGLPIIAQDKLFILVSTANNGAISKLGRLVVTSGMKTLESETMQIEGSAAPVNKEWITGDTIEYVAPAAGSFKGVICTAAGSPGTWKTYGAITA